jgi:hypothetical protein
METQQLKPLTVTQKKILKVLSDGLPHHRQELHLCLPDDLSGITAVRRHIFEIRKYVKSKRQDILCQFIKGKLYFRLIRTISK